jgi:hypothetical protein
MYSLDSDASDVEEVVVKDGMVRKMAASDEPLKEHDLEDEIRAFNRGRRTVPVSLPNPKLHTRAARISVPTSAITVTAGPVLLEAEEPVKEEKLSEAAFPILENDEANTDAVAEPATPLQVSEGDVFTSIEGALARYEAWREASPDAVAAPATPVIEADEARQPILHMMYSLSTYLNDSLDRNQAEEQFRVSLLDTLKTCSLEMQHLTEKLAFLEVENTTLKASLQDQTPAETPVPAAAMATTGSTIDPVVAAMGLEPPVAEDLIVFEAEEEEEQQPVVAKNRPVPTSNVIFGRTFHPRPVRTPLPLDSMDLQISAHTEVSMEPETVPVDKPFVEQEEEEQVYDEEEPTHDQPQASFDRRYNPHDYIDGSLVRGTPSRKTAAREESFSTPQRAKKHSASLVNALVVPNTIDTPVKDEPLALMNTWIGNNVSVMVPGVKFQPVSAQKSSPVRKQWKPTEPPAPAIDKRNASLMTPPAVNVRGTTASHEAQGVLNSSVEWSSPYGQYDIKAILDTPTPAHVAQASQHAFKVTRHATPTKSSHKKKKLRNMRARLVRADNLQNGGLASPAIVVNKSMKMLFNRPHDNGSSLSLHRELTSDLYDEEE